MKCTDTTLNQSKILMYNSTFFMVTMLWWEDHCVSTSEVSEGHDHEVPKTKVPLGQTHYKVHR